MTKIVFAVAKGYPPCFAKAPDYLDHADQEINVRFQVPFKDIKLDIAAGAKVIAVFSVIDKDDLSAIANWLMTMKTEIKEKKCFVFVFAKNRSERLEEIFVRAGCYDILPFDTSAKAFSHKMNRVILLIKHEASVLPVNVEIHGNTARWNSALKIEVGEGGEDFSLQNSDVQITEMITGYPDFWLFKKRSHASRFQRSWLIEMIGPSPATGKWEEVTPQRWKWVPREKHGSFSTDVASWVLTGKRPEYSWMLNRWGFISDTPNLSLVHDASGRVLAVRFHQDADGILKIAANSDWAIHLFPKIKETYARERRMEMRSDHAVPWADRIDSKTIEQGFWEERHLESDPPPESEHKWDASPGVFEIPIGVAAMQSIGLSCSIKNSEGEILEYSDDFSSLVLGVDRSLIKMDETVTFSIQADNLGIPKDSRLTGKVVHVGQADEFGRVLVDLLLSTTSKDAFKGIKDAWEQRQKEILFMFKQAKGM